MFYDALELKNGDKFTEEHLHHIENWMTRAGENFYSLDHSVWDLEKMLIGYYTTVDVTFEEFISIFEGNSEHELSEDAMSFLWQCAFFANPVTMAVYEEGLWDSNAEIITFKCQSVDLNANKAIFVADYSFITLVIECDFENNKVYTSYEVANNGKNNSVDIGMIEYTGLFMGNVLTIDDIGEETFTRLNIAISNNAPFYLNKWKTLSEEEKYVEPLKFELYCAKYHPETNEPISYTFTNTQIMFDDEGKVKVGAHTLLYDVINQTITGGVVISE